MKKLKAINTDRLIALPLRAGDLSELRPFHRDPDVMKYMGGIRSDEDTERWMRDNLKHWNVHGFGVWVFRERADGRFVGRGGLRHAQLDREDEIELGYGLVTRYWGMGLATEMAKAIVSVGFEQLEIESLIALVNPPNKVSRKVLEKLGFRFERDTTWKSVPAMLYRLERGQGTGSHLIDARAKREGRGFTR